MIFVRVLGFLYLQIRQFSMHENFKVILTEKLIFCTSVGVCFFMFAMALQTFICQILYREAMSQHLEIIQ